MELNLVIKDMVLYGRNGAWYRVPGTGYLLLGAGCWVLVQGSRCPVVTIGSPPGEARDGLKRDWIKGAGYETENRQSDEESQTDRTH